MAVEVSYDMFSCSCVWPVEAGGARRVVVCLVAVLLGRGRQGSLGYVSNWCVRDWYGRSGESC